MTKLQAIKRVMEDNAGCATLQEIYANIEKYYPAAKASEHWEAGIRGVLYREIRNGRMFIKLDDGLYGLMEAKCWACEQGKPVENNLCTLCADTTCLECYGLRRNYQVWRCPVHYSWEEDNARAIKQTGVGIERD
jgi:hypothetical protein